MRPSATQVSQQLAALEKRVGRIMIRAQFGKSWNAMTPLEQLHVLAYCERVVGEPKSITFSALRPSVGLEINQSKVWAVAIDCDSELSAYRIGKWAVSLSALVAIQDNSEGYRVRCLGLNPLAWRDALHQYAG